MTTFLPLNDVRCPHKSLHSVQPSDSRKKDKAVIYSVNPCSWLLQNLGKLLSCQREVWRERKINRLEGKKLQSRQTDTIYFSINFLFTCWNKNSALRAPLHLVAIIFTSKLLSLIVIALCSCKTSCSKKLKMLPHIFIQLYLRPCPREEWLYPYLEVINRFQNSQFGQLHHLRQAETVTPEKWETYAGWG